MEKVFDTILDGFYKNKIDYKLIIDNKEEIINHKDELIKNVNRILNGNESDPLLIYSIMLLATIGEKSIFPTLVDVFNLKEEKTENFTVAAPIATSIPMKAVSTAKTVSANNVSFDSGRSVVLSGNIQDVVLSSENQRKSISFFANKDVNDVDVLRPDFQDEAISIKITVPGMGDSAVTTEINLPMDVVSGRR